MKNNKPNEMQKEHKEKQSKELKKHNRLGKNLLKLNIKN